MPPAPSRATISYEPRRLPGASVMRDIRGWRMNDTAPRRLATPSREALYHWSAAVSSWKESYERLRERDEQSPLDPAQLVELATCAYLIGREKAGIAALIRAHQGYVQQRELRAAAGVAARIASMLMNTGDAAQSAGWQARAARLLDECGEQGPEHGYVMLTAARQSVIAGRLAVAETRFAEAAAIGQRYGDADLISLARQGHGRALIERGAIERGVALLDEVMVSVTAGELSP